MEPHANKKPNIVLIMSDQHNPHVLGCAGHRVVETPHLDALARDGVRFSNTYCPYPLCVPSRMAFMSGQYPSEIDIWDNDSIMSSSVPTFAHSLGSAGYEAIMCGRMHFDGPDQFHGFETRLFPEQGSANALSSEIVGSGWYRTNGQTRYAVQVSGHGQTGFRLYDQMVTQTACEFLTSNRIDDRPFCLVVGMMNPHNPLICSPQYFEHYAAKTPLPETTPEAYLAALHPAMKKWRERRGVEEISAEQARRGLAAYYGLVSELDHNVGSIVKAIKASTASENTVIVYCSDHGDMAGEHGMWWKSSFYEGSAKVPCIISWPGEFAQGAVVNRVVSLVDLGPTILELAGADALPDVSGRGFSHLLRSEQSDASWSDEVYSEYMGLLGDQPGCMVRWGPWKLNYYHEFGSYQLFNLDDDPKELVDRRDDPGCQAVAEEGLAKIRDRWSAPDAMISAERQHQASALIGRCGHDLLPHTVPSFDVPEGYNQFDFGQLDWKINDLM